MLVKYDKRDSIQDEHMFLKKSLYGMVWYGMVWYGMKSVACFEISILCYGFCCKR